MNFNLNLDNIKYIKIIYQDSSGNTHCAKASVKSLSEREISACAKFEEPLHIKTPQDISLSIVCENGLYRTTTPLKCIENKDPYVFFIIKTPAGLEYQQNREYFRVQMQEDVLLSFAGKVIPCKMYDISANGIRVQLKEKIDMPENVMLDILFSPKSIKTKAKYIRTDDEDNILKASFYFINLSDTNRDIISQKCIQKQLQDKRNALM